MKTLLLLPLLLAPAAAAQDGVVSAGGSSLEVLGSKWSKSSRKQAAGHALKGNLQV